MNNPQIDTPYKPPQTRLDKEENNLAPAGAPFFTVSIRKLIVMFVMTWGMYVIVYFYFHWRQQKLRHQLDIIPPLRAFFHIFFIHALFQRLQDEAKERRLNLSSGLMLLATLYIAYTLGAFLSSHFLSSNAEEAMGFLVSQFFTLLCLHPLIIFQKHANFLNGDANGAQNSRFTTVNWLFIILGLWMSLGIVVLLFYPEYAVVNPLQP